MEDKSTNFEALIREIKNIIEKINIKKEELKSQIQKIFTNIRNALNNKEDDLLLEVDKKFENIFIKEDLIKKSEKLTNKIKKSLEKGKMLEKSDWKDEYINSLINDCIIIENTIKEIEIINNDLKKSQLNENTEIKIDIKEDKINNLIQNIKSLGKIISREKFYVKEKKPIFELNNHTSNVLCLIVLKDHRLASCARDNWIIIYNEKTYKPDLIIKEHKQSVLCIIQLYSGILASCSDDLSIILYNIQGNNYEVIQTLTYHNHSVLKIKELKNYTLLSCSNDSSIIFYTKNNKIYKNIDKIKTDGSCTSVIQTNDQEICYSRKNQKKISFYNFIEKKVKASISNVSKRNWTDETLLMLNNYLLLVPGENKLSILDTNKYIILKEVEVSDVGWILGCCLIYEDILLTADRKYSIKQWKIDGDNLIYISEKEKVHSGDINCLVNLGEGHFASGSDGGNIKIWWKIIK